MMMERRRPNKLVLVLVGVVHLALTTLTWRDLNRRPANEIRGSKLLWRILSGANTGGSLAYILVGRRRPPTHPSGTGVHQ